MNSKVNNALKIKVFASFFAKIDFDSIKNFPSLFILFYKFNEFQCRIFNFDRWILHPGKRHALNSGSDSTPTILTLPKLLPSWGALLMEFQVWLLYWNVSLSLVNFAWAVERITMKAPAFLYIELTLWVRNYFFVETGVFWWYLNTYIL